jgi:hypothetical protein
MGEVKNNKKSADRTIENGFPSSFYGKHSFLKKNFPKLIRAPTGKPRLPGLGICGMVGCHSAVQTTFLG